MNHMKRESRGRSFSHQHSQSGTTSSNLSIDATYFLNITKSNKLFLTNRLHNDVHSDAR